MYSVLFQSQKIMEYYEPYRPIFMPLIRSGRMGLCSGWKLEPRSIQ